MEIPEATRPSLSGYVQHGKLLPWKWVDARMQAAKSYWIKNVKHLHDFKDRDGAPIALIESRTAAADATRNEADAVSVGGYYFAAIEADENGRPYRIKSRSDFAFCAYPADYGDGATVTYIINVNGHVFGKDLGGERVDQWPAREPERDGWNHY